MDTCVCIVSRVDKLAGNGLGLLLEASKCLSTLSLAYCKITPSDIASILSALGCA